MGLENKTDAAAAKVGQLAGAQPEHRRPVDDEFPAVRGRKRTQNLQQGGFPCAGSAHDGDDFSLINGKIDPPEYFQGAETFFYACCLDNHTPQR